jgi:flagellar biogenesis protein FliO
MPFDMCLMYREEKEFMADGDRTASSAIWAVAMIIIVAMIVGAVYYVTRMGSAQKKIDINVSAPAR